MYDQLSKLTSSSRLPTKSDTLLSALTYMDNCERLTVIRCLQLLKRRNQHTPNVNSLQYPTELDQLWALPQAIAVIRQSLLPLLMEVRP
ncbi:hypothetical protein PILCRDRAFT_13411 [Piloderma croceum F 1598]|uniref:Uncharacterized protein n=1 Tax=Piloderma croceum (strain F 1598) TaxID=765440 RepID=A0A0C3F736_PILCF|nr:hypothetical protein PILCRDRAFT_13411 [Piloderma croceum F 1598]